MSTTYPLEISVADLVEENVEQIIGEIEDVVDNVRKYHQREVMHTEDVDVHELLARHHAIALVWDADMLLARFPQLTRAQAWQVLQHCEREYKPEDGLTWDRIGAVVFDLVLATADGQRTRADRTAKIARFITDYDANGGDRENLVDLLTDVMHWCAEFGDPFEDLCGIASRHFDAETKTSGSGA